MKHLRWFLPLQAIVLVWMAPRLSYWLDEMLTLLGTVQPTLNGMLDYNRTMAGGTPLVFLLPRWSMDLFGNSALAFRVPSILASLASAPAVLLLSRRLNLRTPILAVALFALLPLQLRYSLEIRPYAFALCVTLWLSVAFLERFHAAAYIGLAIAAVLAQPYAIFIVVAHLTWAVMEDRARMRTPLIAIAASAVILLPWYVYYRQDWAAISAVQGIATLDPRAPLVFLHEISGSGYIGAALLFIGTIFGVRRPDRLFWICCLLVPLVAALAANAVFHYFFSVRQVIYVLPVLALLFVAGAQSLGRAGQALLAALLIASLYADVQWFRKPREDWEAASHAAATHVQAGGCMVFLGESTPLYLHFHPELAQHRCDDTATRVVLGVTPYGDARMYPDAVAALEARGLHRQAVQDFAGPRVEVFAP